jgi:hypothetical protein
VERLKTKGKKGNIQNEGLIYPIYSESQKTAGKICLALDVSWQSSKDDNKKSGHIVDKGGVEAVTRVGRWLRADMWPMKVRWADDQGQMHG